MHYNNRGCILIDLLVAMALLIGLAMLWGSVKSGRAGTREQAELELREYVAKMYPEALLDSISGETSDHDFDGWLTLQARLILPSGNERVLQVTCAGNNRWHGCREHFPSPGSVP